MNENSRGKKVLNNILDKGANELQDASGEIIHCIIQELKDWLINIFKKHKNNTDRDVNKELRALENRINISNKSVEIGMQKEEIAVMWAMRKLGYSKEDTEEILNLAKTAYLSKE